MWHLTLVDVASCTWDPPYTRGGGWVGDLSSGYPRHDGPARGKHGDSACASSNIFKHEIECETIFNILQSSSTIQEEHPIMSTFTYE